MKITGIEIGEYRQFKNIKFDFTYPADHAKAGQPLEKVCFIGQSGTGKTTLLNVIWEFIYTIDRVFALSQSSKSNSFSDNFLPDHFSNIEYAFSIDNSSVFFDRKHRISVSDKDFINDWISNLTKTQQYHLMDTDKLCLFIRDSISHEADAFLTDQEQAPQSFSDFIKTDTEIEQDKAKREDRIKSAGDKRVISLGERKSMDTWRYVLRTVSEYDDTGKKFIRDIISQSDSSVNLLIEKLLYWKKNTSNPRNDLADNCLNPVLKHFFLEVDTESAEVPIALRTKQGVKIDNSYLSTGTRQLLATAIPLYKFDTANTVVLFDEPERSLFPDIQRDLVKYYTSLAPAAQFFFATHSPIIASAFEPCERFILYFDENDEVKFHNGVAPEGDDPNDILRQDFDMAELMLQKGLEAYDEYRRLAMAIRAETDEQKKNQLIIERLELGNRYNFAGQYAQNK